MMLDLVVLFTVFLGLVGLLALAHYWQTSRNSLSPAASKRLLNEWLQVHKLKLPTVECMISIFNRKLQDVESEEWEKLELKELLPKTELPVFRLLNADLSSDNRDITLVCGVEWPMCLPGVAVSVLEKGSEEHVTCHFMVDWLNAQIRVVLSEKNGVLLLTLENSHPMSMAVACAVAEGETKNPERLASVVADAIQRMLMGLKLDHVPLVPLYGHTPSLPLVLVSSPEEPQQDQLHGSTSETPSSVDVVSSPPPSEANTTAASHADDETTPPELDPVTPSYLAMNSDPDIATPTSEMMTPIMEEADPILSEATPSSSSSPPLKSSTPRSTSVQDNRTEAKLTNGLAHHDARRRYGVADSPPAIQTPDVPLSFQSPPTEDSTPSDGPLTPGWRRTSSYENLQEIPLGKEKEGGASRSSSFHPKFHELRGSSSTDHLVSPTHLASSPFGKGLTLSMSGSEAESIYGADSRIPSMLVFEVNDSIKVRHIVALSTAHASKLRRHFSNAKKLHVYNDHSFIASHMKGRVNCAVCGEKMSKLFGKHGYVCRDCDMVVHKQCHFKVETSCPSSTVASMNLVYPQNTSVSNL